MPGWLSSTGFNFPINLVSTLAELFIGFLIGAASNRSERNLKTTLYRMELQELQIADVENKLVEALTSNTELTQAVHDLTREIHQSVIGGNDGTGQDTEGLRQGDATETA
jgi:hypothetical protein